MCAMGIASHTFPFYFPSFSFSCFPLHIKALFSKCIAVCFHTGKWKRMDREVVCPLQFSRTESRLCNTKHVTKTVKTVNGGFPGVGDHHQLFHGFLNSFFIREGRKGKRNCLFFVCMSALIVKTEGARRSDPTKSWGLGCRKDLFCQLALML